MKPHLTFHPAAVALAGVVAALSFSGVAQAITDTVFRYSPAKTGFYSIDSMAMSPISTASGTGYVTEWGAGVGPGAFSPTTLAVSMPA